MNKRVFSLPLAMLAVGCSQSQSTKPNIIFILADDMGYGDVSALNENSKIPTPNLDAMIERGLSFSDAHTSSSVSTPTRYGFITGRYNWRSTLKESVYNGYSKALIPESRNTIGDVMQRGGYTTATIGKWHMGWDWYVTQEGTNKGRENEVDPNVVLFSEPITNGPCDRGFDYFYGFNGSLDMPPYVYVENNMPTTDQCTTTQKRDRYGWWRKGATGEDFVHEESMEHFTDKAIEFITGNKKSSNPFFLYLPYPAPHTPILPSEEWRGKSGLNPYGDYVMMLDYEVGRLIASIEQAGIDENTIIVFTADNGCSTAAKIDELHAEGHYPNYIYRGTKADLYDGGHRVPCIVQWPAQIEAGSKSDQIICLNDFLATFASIAGVEKMDTEGEDSFDISPLFYSPEISEPIRPSIIHHSFEGEFAIRMGDWKLLATQSSGGWSYPRPNKPEELEGLPPMQLYNMCDDPSEKCNLYYEHPEIVEQLLTQLRKEITEGRSTPGAAQFNDVLGRWRQIEPLF